MTTTAPIAPAAPAAAGKGGSAQGLGGSVAAGGNDDGSDRRRGAVADGTVKYVLDEVERLRSENESLHEDVDGLRGDVEALKENLDALVKKGKEGPSAAHFDNATGAKPADCPADLSEAGSGAVGGTPAKNKKKNRKKNKGNKVAHNYWGAAAGGNLSKIAVGLVCVALLISISIAVGQGGIGKSYPPIWDQNNHVETSTDEEMENPSDSASLVGLGAGEEITTIRNFLLPKHTKIRGDQTGNFQNFNAGDDSSGSEGVVENGLPFAQFGAPQNLHEMESSVAAISLPDRGAGKPPRTLRGKHADPFGPSTTSASTSRASFPPIADAALPTEPDLPNAQKNTDEVDGSPRDSSPRAVSSADAMFPRDYVNRNFLVSSASLSRASSPPTANALPTESNLPTIAQRNTDGDDGSPRAGSSADAIFSLSYVCDASPETCGCPNLYQTDYRGSISTTKSGLQCETWDVAARELGLDLQQHQQIFPAGLDENFCRNPKKFASGALPPRRRVGAWCYPLKSSGTISGDDWEYCDVPACEALTIPPTTSIIPTSSTGPTGSPSSSLLPTLSPPPTQICPVADNEVCGCEAVLQSDYRGAISTTADGVQCERWDSEWVVELLGRGGVENLKKNAGVRENFCRKTGPLRGPFCFTRIPTPGSLHGYERNCDIPKCDPCSCMPPCGKPNEEACACPSVLQASACCEKEDASCKCGYLRDACRKSLENNGMEFCEDAEIACCEGNIDSNCKCDMYEWICSKSASQNACDLAAGVCCEFEEDWTGNNHQCFCDFHTYSSTFLTHESEHRSGNCSEARGKQSSENKNALRHFYLESGGKDWINDDGWLDNSVPPCEWFGLHCNDDGNIDEINLRNNNLAGGYILPFPQLTKLDLAGNKLSGELKNADIKFLRQLVSIDLSGNHFSGHADMTFPPSTLYANYSLNKFTSAGFRRFNPAFKTLEVVDLSHNQIDQDVSKTFLNIPPKLKKLILSDNAMKGALPNPFPLEGIERFSIGSNAINGPLPDFSRSALPLGHLDLSNQKYEENGGLSGTIPAVLSDLRSLSHLNLAGNKLVGDIPPALGNLQDLKVLNLSSNALSGSIPLDLARLEDVLEVLDFSTNQLTGSIPVQLAYTDGALILFYLRGNSNISDPAPLGICSLPGFDLQNDAMSCPPERNALQEFFVSAKGREWTESTLWLDPFASHCNYFGVTCNERNNVIKLELHNNGLSGKLSKGISALRFLEDLDLSDNDIKGSIPAEIGNLTNLKYLRLSHNGFIGNKTDFGNLQHLKRIQVHGNRLSGILPRLNIPFSSVSSFVSDCGNPSDFVQSLVCEDCTMCCNAQGDCHHAIQNEIQKIGFTKFSGVFIACIFVASTVLALAAYTHNKHKNQELQTTPSLRATVLRTPSRVNRDKERALKTIGDNSVYKFFLGKSWVGWPIVLLVVVAQMWFLSIFVGGAEIDWTNDKSDFVYAWKCPRDQVECSNTNDLTWQGWFAFAILMITFLLKDIINGTKLIVLSAKERRTRNERIRFFTGGTLLTVVSVFTFYVSAIYNDAIATNDREIIENSVIILFILDIDEMLYDILMAINPGWVKMMSRQGNYEEPAVEAHGCEAEKQASDEEGGFKSNSHKTDQNLEMQDQSGADQRLEGEVHSLKTLVATLQETVKQQDSELKRFLAILKAKEHFPAREVAHSDENKLSILS